MMSRSSARETDSISAVARTWLRQVRWWSVQVGSILFFKKKHKTGGIWLGVEAAPFDPGTCHDVSKGLADLVRESLGGKQLLAAEHLPSPLKDGCGRQIATHVIHGVSAPSEEDAAPTPQSDSYLSRRSHGTAYCKGHLGSWCLTA